MKPTDTLERRARDLYLRAGARVDTATAAQLRAAREKALGRGQHHRIGWMAPAGAFAVAALAVVMIWQPLRGPTPAPAATPGMTAEAGIVTALPPDADDTDPALYQNLDFYTWLAAQPKIGQANPGQ